MESIKYVADAIDSSSEVFGSSRARVYTEEEIYNELELMGMTSDDFDDAYLSLVEHPEKTRAVFSYPLHKRMNILRKMMGSRE
ncbi:hypothetical protein L1887_34257 [Cichorium endivia]|nr:hypothetical protein L1887_34257 [Cichorium endivia]